MEHHISRRNPRRASSLTWIRSPAFYPEASRSVSRIRKGRRTRYLCATTFRRRCPPSNSSRIARPPSGTGVSTGHSSSSATSLSRGRAAEPGGTLLAPYSLPAHIVGQTLPHPLRRASRMGCRWAGFPSARVTHSGRRSPRWASAGGACPILVRRGSATPDSYQPRARAAVEAIAKRPPLSSMLLLSGESSRPAGTTEQTRRIGSLVNNTSDLRQPRRPASSERPIPMPGAALTEIDPPRGHPAADVPEHIFGLIVACGRLQIAGAATISPPAAQRLDRAAEK